MKNNIKTGWKSTITGIVVLLVALVYMLFAETLNFYAFGSAMVVGVLLLFSPDTLINLIGDFFKNKKVDDLDKE